MRRVERAAILITVSDQSQLMHGRKAMSKQNRAQLTIGPISRTPETDRAVVSRQPEEEVLSVLAPQCWLLQPTVDHSKDGCSSPRKRRPVMPVKSLDAIR